MRQVHCQRFDILRHAFRRGQALGFTVAELFTLLLFLVLLILAAVAQHQRTAEQAFQKKLERTQNELAEARKTTQALAERDRRLLDYFGVANNFGDDFNDLVPSKEGMSARERQRALVEEAKAIDEINAFLNQSESSARKSAKPSSDYDPRSLTRRVESCFDEKERLQGEVANVAPWRGIFSHARESILSWWLDDGFAERLSRFIQ